MIVFSRLSTGSRAEALARCTPVSVSQRNKSDDHAERNWLLEVNFISEFLLFIPLRDPRGRFQRLPLVLSPVSFTKTGSVTTIASAGFCNLISTAS